MKSTARPSVRYLEKCGIACYDRNNLIDKPAGAMVSWMVEVTELSEERYGPTAAKYLNFEG